MTGILDIFSQYAVVGSGRGVPALFAPVAAGPMEQFEVFTIVPLYLGQLDVSFTNSSLWMVLILAVAALFMVAGTRKASLVPGRAQAAAEVLYTFIADMLRDATGQEGMKFFPYIFTLFMFIFLSNLLGLIPSIPSMPQVFHTFTVTSHIIVTLALAMMTILLVLVTGFTKQGVGFLKVFVPSGVPLWLLWLVVIIEVVSFLARPLSLAIRLFANMLAGHMILKIFAGFVVAMLAAGPAIGWMAIFPVLGNVAVILLELLVAFLQAYVFAMLSCIYLNDAVNEAHH